MPSHEKTFKMFVPDKVRKEFATEMLYMSGQGKTHHWQILVRNTEYTKHYL